jgi:hypothetical protein
MTSEQQKLVFTWPDSRSAESAASDETAAESRIRQGTKRRGAGKPPAFWIEVLQRSKGGSLWRL